MPVMHTTHTHMYTHTVAYHSHTQGTLITSTSLRIAATMSAFTVSMLKYRNTTFIAARTFLLLPLIRLETSSYSQTLGANTYKSCVCVWVCVCLEGKNIQNMDHIKTVAQNVLADNVFEGLKERGDRAHKYITHQNGIPLKLTHCGCAQRLQSRKYAVVLVVMQLLQLRTTQQAHSLIHTQQMDTPYGYSPKSVPRRRLAASVIFLIVLAQYRTLASPYLSVTAGGGANGWMCNNNWPKITRNAVSQPYKRGAYLQITRDRLVHP